MPQNKTNAIMFLVALVLICFGFAAFYVKATSHYNAQVSDLNLRIRSIELNLQNVQTTQHKTIDTLGQLVVKLAEQKTELDKKVSQELPDDEENGNSTESEE